MVCNTPTNQGPDTHTSNQLHNVQFQLSASWSKFSTYLTFVTYLLNTGERLRYTYITAVFNTKCVK